MIESVEVAGCANETPPLLQLAAEPDAPNQDDHAEAQPETPPKQSRRGRGITFNVVEVPVEKEVLDEVVRYILAKAGIISWDGVVDITKPRLKKRKPAPQPA
jgi:hypothetical protein